MFKCQHIIAPSKLESMPAQIAGFQSLLQAKHLRPCPLEEV